MTRLEDLVQDTLTSLADEARPADLGRTALRGARQRRYAMAGGICTVLAVMAIAVPIGLTHTADRAPNGATNTSATPKPTRTVPLDHLVNIGGYDIAGWASQGGTPAAPSVVYDYGRDRYVTINYAGAVAAPRGGLVAVQRQDEPYDVGLLDLRTDKVRWLRLGDYHPGDLQWSPDGAKLLVSIDSKDAGSPGFAVVDATTLHLATHWIDTSRFDTGEVAFSWYPDGKQVLTTIADRSAGEAQDLVDHLQLFDLDGRPTRTIPVKSHVYGAASWSPDGRYVVGYDQNTLTAQIIQVNSGRLIATVPHVPGFTTGIAWWTTNGEVLVQRNNSTLVKYRLHDNRTVTYVVSSAPKSREMAMMLYGASQ